LLCAAFLWRGLYVSGVAFGLAVGLQSWALMRYVDRGNRKLAELLRAIEYTDFSQRFSFDSGDDSFAELGSAFNAVVARFREIGADREESLRYFHAVVEHVGVGLLAFDSFGEVDLVNSAAKRLLDIRGMRNVEELREGNPELCDALLAIRPGEQELVTISAAGDIGQLAVAATELGGSHKSLTLVSLQNISSELSEKEMDAWQNLIRVLTHETKNSLTPIGSLAASVERIISEADSAGSPLEAEAAEKVRDALAIIRKRSRGLLEFVDSYRKLTHIPAPDCTTFVAAELVARVEELVRPELRGRSVGLVSKVEPESLSLTADAGLIEQALLNLVLNAIQASDEQPGAAIGIEAALDSRGRPEIRVRDNGPGIQAGSIEQVFVPFFSTKREGSGIGLSLARQIMRLHGGSLTVASEPGVETVFTMRF
jgi:nitrogen fixation/metabolism regulation signal transduction histidine kinase